MSDELKPCPFCGVEEAEVFHDIDNYSYTVQCLNCAAEAEWHTIESAAKESWNTRPIEDALLARAERAEAALKALIEWIDADDLCDDLCTPEYLAIKQAARDIVKGR